MTHNRPDTLSCILILFMVIILTKGDLQDLFYLQHRGKHLPQTKFGSSDYEDYSDANEAAQASSESIWNRTPLRDNELPLIRSTQQLNQLNQTSPLDSHIKWDKNWGAGLDFGQLSAVSLDPNGNVVLFCRRERIWGQDTFDIKNIFNKAQGPIKQNTIIIFDKSGKIILEWGRNMFYLPHGLTIDFEGNYWLTDVAMHQVFKFNAQDIEKNKDKLKQLQNHPVEDFGDVPTTDSFSNSIIKPVMILGEAFVPGNDHKRFCKPTAVVVAKNGDFFVSDGYCNSKVIKFNSKGERITEIGRSNNINIQFLSSYALLVPHDLAIADDLGYIYVADREHGRVLCYFAENITFHKEFKNPIIGTKVYGVAYARELLYLVNGPDPFSSNKFHVRGFVIDIHSGNVISQFGPNGDMITPHDIAVSDDGSEIYVAELSNQVVYRFLPDESFRKIKSNVSKLQNSTNSSSKSRRLFIPLTDDSNETPGRMNLTTLIMTIVVSIMILIGLCVGIAAIVARCQKRGCLLSVRRREYWMNERKDNFKLSSLFDNRQLKNFRVFDNRPNTRDFSKLNTEPETTDDEHIEDSLII